VNGKRRRKKSKRLSKMSVRQTTPRRRSRKKDHPRGRREVMGWVIAGEGFSLDREKIEVREGGVEY